jgi:hypothetical protein
MAKPMNDQQQLKREVGAAALGFLEEGMTEPQ